MGLILKRKKNLFERATAKSNKPQKTVTLRKKSGELYQVNVRDWV